MLQPFSSYENLRREVRERKSLCDTMAVAPGVFMNQCIHGLAAIVGHTMCKQFYLRVQVGHHIH